MTANDAADADLGWGMFCSGTDSATSSLTEESALGACSRRTSLASTVGTDGSEEAQQQRRGSSAGQQQHSPQPQHKMPPSHRHDATSSRSRYSAADETYLKHAFEILSSEGELFLHPKDSLVLHRHISQQVVHPRGKRCVPPSDGGAAVESNGKEGGVSYMPEDHAGAGMSAAMKAPPAAPPPPLPPTTNPSYSMEAQDGKDSRVAESRGYGRAAGYLERNAPAFLHDDVELCQGFDLGLTLRSLEALVSPLVVQGGSATLEEVGAPKDDNSMAAGQDTATCENYVHHDHGGGGGGLGYEEDANDDEVFAFEL